VQAVPFANWSDGDYRLIPSGTPTQEIPGVDAKALCTALGIAARNENICVRHMSEDPHSAPHIIGTRN